MDQLFQPVRVIANVGTAGDGYRRWIANKTAQLRHCSAAVRRWQRCNLGSIVLTACLRGAGEGAGGQRTLQRRGLWCDAEQQRWWEEVRCSWSSYTLSDRRIQIKNCTTDDLPQKVMGLTRHALPGAKHSRAGLPRLAQEEALCVACGCLRSVSGWLSPSAEMGPVQSEWPRCSRIRHVNLTFTFTFTRKHP